MDLIYEGSPALAGAFAQMLREEGLSVEYEPPDEDRAAGEQAVRVVLHIGGVFGDEAATVAATVAVERAIERFRQRWPRARIETSEDP